MRFEGPRLPLADRRLTMCKPTEKGSERRLSPRRVSVQVERSSLHTLCGITAFLVNGRPQPILARHLYPNPTIGHP